MLAPGTVSQEPKPAWNSGKGEIARQALRRSSGLRPYALPHRLGQKPTLDGSARSTFAVAGLFDHACRIF
jgi:hypothetical protein